jgi:hypothetical protein
LNRASRTDFCSESPRLCQLFSSLNLNSLNSTALY